MHGLIRSDLVATEILFVLVSMNFGLVTICMMDCIVDLTISDERLSSVRSQDVCDEFTARAIANSLGLITSYLCVEIYTLHIS